MNKVTFLYFAMWFGGALWCVSDRFIDPELTPKGYFALGGAALFCAACALLAFRQQKPRRQPRFSAVTAAIVLCALSQAVYALLQWSGACPATGTFPVCGSFDNPAGVASALIFSLPFALGLTEHDNAAVRKGAWAAAVLLAVAIVATGSRSGMLSVGAVLLVFLPMKWPRMRRKLTVALLATLAVVAVALYHYKRDSADGRLLIWQCTARLMGQRPLTGHGPGGFRAHYMNAQADYFRTHPDSPYARLADDVKASFNEYLGLLTDFGLAGGLLLTAACTLLFRAWRRHPGDSSRPALLCLVAVGVFSLFSYPFRYAHTWMFCGLSAAVLLHNAWPLPHQARQVTTAAAAVCLLVVSGFALRRMQAEMRWCETANRSLCGLTEKMLPTYRDLYGELKDDPLFLYNYSAELNVAGRYAESLRIGGECEAALADYFIQLLQADNCRQLGRHDEAIRRLRQASYMCPNRFTPLYELYKLHKTLGDTAAVRRLATAILHKPIKVDSPEVQRILAEIRREQHHADRQQLISEP